ncbi:hypothetical protein PPL_00555 [Heterostelium album PN500]|uniref:Uncharacterized protein n=1 Tax=Heterostelium pallidum (strain ATCC 26659 / Pp 5 / PN500) TaxID=670386 RepID=D3AWS7_HETP5|nr:hypothetical protein PPL_00555 [Heterostelium album PN500]EFA86750.1 hypothetical protein PPL_00555 [Heterostelium album PN500]|eukprot:XP_020438854.1 hypothetical protein PPL_00555 [Heterostelium album PN500]
MKISGDFRTIHHFKLRSFHCCLSNQYICRLWNSDFKNLMSLGSVSVSSVSSSSVGGSSNMSGSQSDNDITGRGCHSRRGCHSGGGNNGCTRPRPCPQQPSSCCPSGGC